MDRERKLLYTVAVLAVMENALLFPAYQNRSDLFTHEANMESVSTCEAKLIRTYKACLPRLRPLPLTGTLKHGGYNDHLGL